MKTPKYVNETENYLSSVLYDIASCIDVDIEGKTIKVSAPMDYVNEIQSVLDDFVSDKYITYIENSADEWYDSTEEFYISVNSRKYKTFINVLKDY